MASLQRFVPATCPMKFNKLNSVRHVAGTKYPPNWCCTIIKESVHTRGHVAATYPWDMYPQHFHVCANVVILSLLHVPATCPCYVSSQCVLNKVFVAAACRCDMSLQHDPSCLPTLMESDSLEQSSRFQNTTIKPVFYNKISQKKSFNPRL